MDPFMRSEALAKLLSEIGKGKSPAEAAESAKAEAPLRPKVTQKAADEGLFGDESQQTDLVDMARKAEPKLYSAPRPMPANDRTPLDLDQGETFTQALDEEIEFQNTLASREYAQRTREYSRTRQNITGPYGDHALQESLRSKSPYDVWAAVDAWAARNAPAARLPAQSREALLRQMENIERMVSPGGKYAADVETRSPKIKRGREEVRAQYDRIRKDFGLAPVGEDFSDPAWAWKFFGDPGEPQYQGLKAADLRRLIALSESGPGATLNTQSRDEIAADLLRDLSLYSAPHRAREPSTFLEAANLGRMDREAGNPARRDLPANLQVAYDSTYRRGAHEGGVSERAAALDQAAATTEPAEPQGLLEAADLGRRDREAGRPPRRDLPANLQTAYDSSYRSDRLFRDEARAALPLKSDKASAGKRQRLEAALNDALRHMLGPNAPRLELPDRITADGVTAWGLVPMGKSGPTGAYTPAQRLAASVIEVALGHPSYERRPQDKFSTFVHEVAHAFHDHMASLEELALFEREVPRMRERAKEFRGMTDEEAASIDPMEAIAVDFERYATNRATGNPGTGTHIGLRRFYERILQFLRDVANTLRRAFGYTRPEDIWSDLYEGKMADRPDLKTGREFASREPVLPGEEGRVAEPTFGAAAARVEGGKLYAAPRPVTGALAKTDVAKSFKRFWTSTFQPELVSDRAFEAAPQFARYKSAQAQEKDAIVHSTEGEWDYWNRRGDVERLPFLDRMERGQAQADPEQDAMAQQWRQALDRNWAEEARWGSRAAFVQDYVPHIWERPDDWRAFAETRTAQVGPTWFQKKRTYDYISEGLAAGLKLKSTNPVDLIVHRLLSGVDMRQRMQLLYKLKDLGLAWEGAQGGQQLVDRGWRAINAPDRKQWVIAPDAQLLWKNAVEAQGLWQAEHVGGSLFRGWMAFKNAWVPVKLALSGFHPLHVLHISMNNSLARGWTQAKAGDVMGMAKSIGEGLATIPTLGLPQYVSGRRGKQAWITPKGSQTPEQKAMVALMNKGGFVPQLSEQMRIAAQRQLAEAFQKVLRREAGVSDWRKLISASLRRPLEKLQAPIFEHWIPALKTHAYLAEAAALLKRDPALLNNDEDLGIALHAIAKSVDNRFGEMFYGNLFWNRYVKDGAIGSFLSLGWNYGFLREFGGAAMETVSRPLGVTPMFAPSRGRQIARSATNKIPNAILYFGTAALMLGAMSYMLSDDNHVPEGWDFIFPRVGGTNPDGTPRRITSMTYLREVPMLLKHVAARGGNWFWGTADMLWNKMMFAPFTQLWSNRDYYGRAIWDENAPWYQEMWQAARHMFTPEPISVESYKRALETGGTLTKDVPLAALGFSPAPSYAERSAIQNRIAFLFEEHASPESRAYEEPGEGEAKRAARSAVLAAKQKGDSAALEEARKQAFAAGLTGKQIAAVGRTPSDIYMFSKLPPIYQAGLLRQASDDEFHRYYQHADKSIKRGGEFRDRLNNLSKVESAGQPYPRYTPGVFDRNGVYTPPPSAAPAAPRRPAPTAPTPAASGNVMGRMSPFGAYQQ